MDMDNKNTLAGTTRANSEQTSKQIISQLPDNWRYAISYEKRGWAIFPCKGKVPLTPNGFKDATTDIGQILAWAKQYPDANIAIATGNISGIFVVDADEHSAAQMLQKQSLVTKTVIGKTGRGYHCIYRIPDGVTIPCKTGLLPKVDIRGTGGYIIAPPSIHPSGKRYEFLYSPKDTAVADPPAKLVDLILNGVPSSSPEDTSAQTRNVMELREVAQGGIQEHDGRNQAATRLFGYLLRHYVDVKVAVSLLEIWNGTNSPPLTAHELNKVMESVSGRELMRRKREGASS